MMVELAAEPRHHSRHQRKERTMRLVAVMLAAGIVAGCQATDANTPNLLLSSGHLRVLPGPDRNTAIVQTLNTMDVGGFNMDRAADRRAIVRNLLRAQCGEPEIIDAQVTTTGDPGAIRQLRTYTLTVRCPNGVTSPAER